MYEAGANILWVDPGVTRTSSELPIEEPAYATVWRYANQFFSKDAAVVVGSTGYSRLIFPMVLEGYVSKPEFVLQKDHFRSTVPLVGGHCVLYAWYLAMHQAIQQDDKEWAALLWRCGLTVTLQVRVGAGVDSIYRSIAFSERLKAQEIMSDSFLTFAKKVTVLLDKTGAKIHKPLADKGVRFNGAPFSAAMLRTIQLMNAQITHDSEVLLRQIERVYGRDVLTGSPTKLMRVLHITQKASEGNACQAENIVLFTISALLIGLQRGLLVPRCITADFLDKKRDGAPGWANCTIAKRQAGSPQPPVHR